MLAEEERGQYYAPEELGLLLNVSKLFMGIELTEHRIFLYGGEKV